MAEESFTVFNLIRLESKGRNSLNLKCIGGRLGLRKKICNGDINRPGLALTGFFECFEGSKIQLFGAEEVAYLERLKSENRTDTIRTFFSYDIPCVVFTGGISESSLYKEFMDIAEEVGCAVLLSDLETTEFTVRLLRVFSNIFAQKQSMHAVMVEVFGIGVLIRGKSGVGKSESALELVERGHRLVADDVVELRCVDGNSVLARGPNEILGHHMEIRGLGIVNVAQLYGVSCILEQKEVQLIIDLSEWDAGKPDYERLGTEEKFDEILGVKIPLLKIPVKPGRNVPIIVEAAAMNERLKRKGFYTAKIFNQNVLRWIEMCESKNTYYSKVDSY